MRALLLVVLVSACAPEEEAVRGAVNLPACFDRYPVTASAKTLTVTAYGCWDNQVVRWDGLPGQTPVLPAVPGGLAICGVTARLDTTATPTAVGGPVKDCSFGEVVCGHITDSGICVGP